MKRVVLLSAGFCSLGLGIVGIFLSVLPTIPFLLLSASCFLKSSDRLYRWLTIGSTVAFFVDSFIVRAVLILIALGVTVHLLRMKTLTPEMLASDE